MRSFLNMTPEEQAEVRRRMLPDKILGLIVAGIFFTLPFLIYTYG